MSRAGDRAPHTIGELGTFEASADSEWKVVQKLDNFVRYQERKYIEMTLKFNQGSREKTASMLGISIATLYRKLDLKHYRNHHSGKFPSFAAILSATPYHNTAPEHAVTHSPPLQSALWPLRVS